MNNSECEHPILKRLVETPSIYPHEEQISQVVRELLIEHGFSVVEQDIGTVYKSEKGRNRKNIFGIKGSGDRSILFYGHLDTVPLVNLDQWGNLDPFKLTRIDNYYYGLGSADTKAGISAFFEATYDSDKYTKVLLAVDEENISAGAWAAVQAEETKQFFDDVEFCISTEPSFQPHDNVICTGRTGRTVYEVNFAGSPEHLANYKRARDSIEMLGNFISRLYGRREEMFNSEYSVGQIRKVTGESVGMSVCANASADIEVLLGPGDTTESVSALLQTLTDSEVRIQTRQTPYLQGYQFKNFPYNDLINQIILEHTGKTVEFEFRSSVGDDNVIGAYLQIPIITWGPIGYNEHRPNEHVDINSLNIKTKMYKAFLDRV